VTSDFWQAKRVLVGGGAGFLGSYLVPALVEAGAQVAVADRDLAERRLEPFASVRHAVDFICGDLREREACERLMRDRHVAINLAATTYGMDYSRAHHGEMLVQNLLSGLVPLEAARAQRVGRYVIVSSACVYPDDAPIPTPELDVFSGLPEPDNEGYGWAKRILELAGTYYAREGSLKITIVRPFNLYGANYQWEDQERAHVIPLLVKRVLDGEDPVVVWGSGRQRRNFLHAHDAARLILRIIEKDDGPAPVNIGFDDETEMQELIDLICEVAGMRPRIVFDTTKPEGQFRKAADPARLRSLTDGYVPTVSLRDGIAEMIEWYRRSFQSLDT
jgi:nucleoside-diphosphate-sugar epimerase